MTKTTNWFRDHYHQLAIGFWLLAIVPTLIWWKNSVLWIAIMSLYANIWISLQVLLQKKEE